MLSERAKGKQRAIDPLPRDPEDIESGQSSASGFQEAEEETSRDLVIRFTEGAPDLTIHVDKLDSVRDVKQRIREIRPELEKNRLRLIHSGRLLPDATLVYVWLASVEERQQRVKIDDREAEAGGGAGTIAGKASTTWIHCSTAQIQPVRGFDRLASVGFSAEDIENIREQFHSQSSSNYLDTDFATEEEYDEHARVLEEQWMDGGATMGQSGPGNASVLQGILVGFFFPFIPFFLWQTQKPPVFWEDDSEQEPTSNVIFSRRMSMALVVGFLANLLFGVWRFLLDSS
ncbi:hypothetical protein CVT25_014098 [Psilocybe cyanescens]|uniref:Ubiquitin-like domain-containing protein n=1 Tax=Psilocybe cyanescens TaxID=93625 RepID=A0A409XGD6_PSICY|nr:hypothetical protein CVT25_014098 [Psilocybe cyanescens]